MDGDLGAPVSSGFPRLPYNPPLEDRRSFPSAASLLSGVAMDHPVKVNCYDHAGLGHEVIRRMVFPSHP